MPQRIRTIQDVDHDIREISIRLDRCLQRGELELAETYQNDLDHLLDDRLELTRGADDA